MEVIHYLYEKTNLKKISDQSNPKFYIIHKDKKRFIYPHLSSSRSLLQQKSPRALLDGIVEVMTQDFV
jgi:hypothetical protein